MVATSASEQRLEWYIEAILIEEKKFHRWIQQLNLDYNHLDRMHEEGLCCHGDSPEDVRLCRSHEAVLGDHHLIHGRHVRLLNYCQKLSELAAEGRLSTRKIDSECQKLSRLYDQMRRDHNRIEKERRALLAEHEAFVQLMAMRKAY